MDVCQSSCEIVHAVNHKSFVARCKRRTGQCWCTEIVLDIAQLTARFGVATDSEAIRVLKCDKHYRMQIEKKGNK
jgi:hypothetical protein